VITVGAISTALISCWSAGFAIKHPSTPLFAVELVIDILFMMDVLLNFNTGRNIALTQSVHNVVPCLCSLLSTTEPHIAQSAAGAACLGCCMF